MVGELWIIFICDNIDFMFEGFVVEDLDVEVFVGIFFMEVNDVVVWFVKREVFFGNGFVYIYGFKFLLSFLLIVCRVFVFCVFVFFKIVWFGEFLEV